MDKKLRDKKMIDLGKRMVRQTEIMLKESRKFQLLLDEMKIFQTRKEKEK